MLSLARLLQLLTLAATKAAPQHTQQMLSMPTCGRAAVTMHRMITCADSPSCAGGSCVCFRCLYVIERGMLRDWLLGLCFDGRLMRRSSATAGMHMIGEVSAWGGNRPCMAARVSWHGKTGSVGMPSDVHEFSADTARTCGRGA